MATEFNCLDIPDVILEQRMCLNALSKDLKGNLEFLDARREECEKPECRTLKTMHSLRVRTQSGRCDSKLGSLFDGELIIERLVSAYEEDGDHRGFHAGDFVWNTLGVHAAGRISGMTNVGTHRRPYFDECQQCDDRGVMEGRICGQVIEAKMAELDRCQIFGVYRIRFDSSESGGSGTVGGVIEGVLICPCQ